jgi:hypothetical protein
MTVGLDDVHNASTDVEVYFIEERLATTPNGAVGAAKRQFREDYADADKVGAKKMRETRNGFYVMAMAKPEPNYLDQVALRVLRDNSEPVGDVTNYQKEPSSAAAEHLIDKVFEKVHTPTSFELDEVKDALERNHSLYADLVEP